jgi:hypothetical protein
VTRVFRAIVLVLGVATSAAPGIVRTGVAWAQAAPTTIAPSGSSPATAPGHDSTAPAPLAEALAGAAKQDYAGGLLLYQNGDFAGALLKFQRSYEESGDPRLLWNAAVCEKAMRHFVKAIALVRRYLETLSPLITPEAERSAEAFLEAAEPLTVPLEVTANKPNAEIDVDGEFAGFAPSNGTIRVDIGTHRVTVKLAGFTEYSASLTIAGSDDARVTVVLTPIGGQEGERDRDSSRAAARSTGGWAVPALVGGGILAVAGGATIAMASVLLNGEQNTLQSNCARLRESDCLAARPANLSAAQTAANHIATLQAVRWVGVGGALLGAAAATSGLLRLVTQPRASPRSGRASIGASANALEVHWQGEF